MRGMVAQLCASPGCPGNGMLPLDGLAEARRYGLPRGLLSMVANRARWCSPLAPFGRCPVAEITFRACTGSAGALAVILLSGPSRLTVVRP
jgi:hypothetical protein